jgi:hypothetical protein
MRHNSVATAGSARILSQPGVNRSLPLSRLELPCPRTGNHDAVCNFVILDVVAVNIDPFFVRPGSACSVLSPSLLAWFQHFVQVCSQPYLDRSEPILKAGKFRDKLNGVIEVSRLKNEKAAELFLGFCIGSVGGRDFAVFPVQGHCGLRRLESEFSNNLSVGAQMVIVAEAFVEHGVSLVLRHVFECPWLDVSQTDVFHLRTCAQPGASVYRFPVGTVPARS